MIFKITAILHVSNVLVMVSIVQKNFARADSEISTLMDDTSSYAELTSRLTHLLNLSIKEEENRLARLANLREIFSAATASFRIPTISNNNVAISESLKHPTYAFIALNNLVRLVEELYALVYPDLEANDLEYLKSELADLESKFGLPTHLDIRDYGETILRLQTFYQLATEDIVNGKLMAFGNATNQSEHSPSDEVKMNARQCFELGKIAYEADDHGIASSWFKKALQIFGHERHCLKVPPEECVEKAAEYGSEELFINELLDYLAFSAYKNGKINYAAKITKIWLTREPNNERALENLEYFEDELSSQDKSKEKGDLSRPSNVSLQDELDSQSNVTFYSPGREFNTKDYALIEDEVLRNLCTRSFAVSHLNCVKKLSLNNYISLSEIKVEILNEQPLVMRIHDFITDNEAKHLQELAKPKLKRSTVQSKFGHVTSDFRIAKTAWLSSKRDPVVQRIEQRVGLITNLDLHDSEELQVVNYGLGGYYGPHLDSARETSANKNFSSLKLTSFHRNDRLATVLIYLNKVPAGGATAFPRLNLTVIPIANSAVIWYNLKRNGFTDDKTLHSGCPVLVGTKWVATKWPREQANSFLRPCHLTQVM